MTFQNLHERVLLFAYSNSRNVLPTITGDTFSISASVLIHPQIAQILHPYMDAMNLRICPPSLAIGSMEIIADQLLYSFSLGKINRELTTLFADAKSGNSRFACAQLPEVKEVK